MAVDATVVLFWVKVMFLFEIVLIAAAVESVEGSVVLTELKVMLGDGELERAMGGEVTVVFVEVKIKAVDDMVEFSSVSVLSDVARVISFSIIVPAVVGFF